MTISDDDKTKAFIPAECLRLAFQSLQVSLIGLLGGIIVIYIMVDRISDRTTLLTWAGFSILVIIARYFLIHAYNRSDKEDNELSHWQNLFILGAAASGLSLGLSGAILVEDPLAREQFIIILMICGFIVAASSSLYSIPISFFAFATFAIVPTTYRMVSSGYNQTAFVSIMLLAMVLYAGITVIRHKKGLDQRLFLQFNNDELVTRLRAERDSSKRLNEQLSSEVFERKRIQNALFSSQDKILESKEAAEIANKAKSDFLSSMSHELRTPLNAIIGYSSIMADKTFGDISNKKYEGYPSHIYEAGEHLLSIIDNMLDISKIDANKLDFQETVVEPNNLIELALHTAEKHAASKSIKIEVDLPMPLPCLKGDPLRLKQVLINFLSNAIKFTPENGIINIGAFLDAQNDMVFFVNDSGKGMSEDEYEIAMTPFGQVDKFQDGTGLGLPLCKKLIEFHGGEIRLTSNIGKGTTVAFNLPKERIIAA